MDWTTLKTDSLLEARLDPSGSGLLTVRDKATGGELHLGPGDLRELSELALRASFRELEEQIVTVVRERDKARAELKQLEQRTCEHPSVRSTTLRGGAGPDNAAESLDCNICGATGWKWLDGSESWRPVP